VTINEEELDRSGLLLFQVIEGPRVRVKAVDFDGNEAFQDKQLAAEIKSKPSIPLIRKGVLDQDVMAEDIGALDRFYKARGYLDVRVDRQIVLSPDNREAKIVFLVEEGEQFVLRTVTATSIFGDQLEVFAPEQIAAMLEIRPGDVYREDLVRKSARIIDEAYGRLGYLADVPGRVRYEPIRSGEGAFVDLNLRIDEGERARVGVVTINGNSLTRDKVIRRLIRLEPGRLYDSTEVNEARARIARTRLFNDVRITVQDPDPQDPEYRDLLVEIKERNTGSVNFGLAVGSDAGVFGELSVNQRNFDITDWPKSFDELFKGAAFRGGGQTFNATLSSRTSSRRTTRVASPRAGVSASSPTTTRSDSRHSSTSVVHSAISGAAICCSAPSGSS
jgi:outer membrane protein insertion porin family